MTRYQAASGPLVAPPSVMWNQQDEAAALDGIGKVYGVTRERIRQIESKAMSKLRHPSRSNAFRDYLG